MRIDAAENLPSSTRTAAAAASEIDVGESGLRVCRGILVDDHAVAVTKGRPALYNYPPAPRNYRGPRREME